MSMLHAMLFQEKRPLASLSKMMTFLLAIEAIENKEVSKDDIIVVDKDIAKVRGSSYLDLLVVFFHLDFLRIKLCLYLDLSIWMI